MSAASARFVASYADPSRAPHMAWEDAGADVERCADCGAERIFEALNADDCARLGFKVERGRCYTVYRVAGGRWGLRRPPCR